MVQVAYYNYGDPVPDVRRYTGEGWVYYWTLPFPPRVGMRVIVPAVGARKAAVIVGIGPPARDLRGIKIQRPKRGQISETVDTSKRKRHKRA